MRSNELYHYGVLGMRWGVRRTHNKYGQLTPAGYKKSIQLSNEYEKLAGVRTLTEKGKQRKNELARQYTQLTGKKIDSKADASEALKQKIKSMTNEELAAYNSRKQLESTFLNYQNKNTTQQVNRNRNIKELSNDELSAINARLLLEKTYINNLPKEQESKVKKIVSGLMKEQILPLVRDAGLAYVKKRLEEDYDIKVDSGGNKKKKKK